jgi:hypothetical protein
MIMNMTAPSKKGFTVITMRVLTILYNINPYEMVLKSMWKKYIKVISYHHQPLQLIYSTTSLVLFLYCSSGIFNYLCNQCLSPLILWVRIQFMQGELDTTLCDKVCQWLVSGLLFSPGTLVSSTNKTDCHDITEMLLKVALKTINITLLSC